MPDDRREEYAEDLDGLDQLPPEVQKYLAESRRFHRQWRGDEGRLTTSTAFLPEPSRPTTSPAPGL